MEARRVCGTSRMLARDERAVLRSGTGVVERGTGRTGSPWSGAKDALVTAPVNRTESIFNTWIVGTFTTALETKCSGAMLTIDVVLTG